MISTDSVSRVIDRETDFVKAWLAIWAAKYYIALVVAICGLVAAGFALRVTPIYRAEIVVIPAGGQNPPGGAAVEASAVLGSLMGATGTVQSTIGAAQRDAMALLRSRYLVGEFVRRNGLVSQLVPKTVSPPSLWLAVTRFRERVLLFTEDRLTGTTTIAIDWTDPEVAARWANGFVALANELARARTLNDSRYKIAYLEEQLEGINVITLRRAGYDTIKSETKTMMLANARFEYAFTIVDPAVVPELRSRPQRTLMVLLGITTGLFASVVVSLSHYLLRNRASRGQGK